MEKYKRLFSIYKIPYSSKIENTRDGFCEYYFKADGYNLKYTINNHDKINAKISKISLIDFLNMESFKDYYHRKKKRDAKEIVENLDLKTKKIIQKHYR